jgi:hypothetical protein
MAHFAELDDSNVVVRVIVVNNEDCLDQNGIESEAVGAAFCNRLLGGRWVQTSYNGNFRRQYAGTGFLYHELLDVFVEQKPYPSWIFDATTATWHPPVPRPTVPDIYIVSWDEENLEWDAVLNRGAV